MSISFARPDFVSFQVLEKVKHENIVKLLAIEEEQEGRGKVKLKKKKREKTSKRGKEDGGEW